MVKRLAPAWGRCIALAVIFPMFFIFGCGSTPTSERRSPVAELPEALPVIQDRLQQSETTTVTAGSAHASEIDEKNSIFFALGSSTVIRSEQSKLHPIAQRLKADHGLFITLIGHANDNGSSSFNLAVADARVQSVGAILKKLGVKPHQIQKRNVGSENLPNTCRSASCRQMMRRVELIVSAAK